MLGFLTAFFVVQLLISAYQPNDWRISAIVPAGVIGWIALAETHGLYEREQVGLARSAGDDLPGLLLLSTLATWVGLLLVNAADLAHPKLHVVTAFWLLSIGAITALRALARMLVQKRPGIREQTLIVGTGRVAQRIAQKLAARPEYGLAVVGFLDERPLDLPEDAPPYLGGLRRLEQVVRAYGVERVMLGFSRLAAPALVDVLRRCAELRVRVDVVPRMYEVMGPRSLFHDLDGIPLISIKPPRLSAPARVMKRALDVVLAALGLVVLAPFFAFAAWRIKRESGGPVFFTQERMGVGGKPFRIYKFRSMTADADSRKQEVGHLNKHREAGPRMFKIADDPRVTPFGRFLRKWSLDELPQLINVLKGEMSLVGPRPLILDEDDNILGHHRRRLNLTPGLTGLWQVLGRSDIPFAEMVTLDYKYVTNWSLWGDIKLLAQTVPAIVRGRGAY